MRVLVDRRRVLQRVRRSGVPIVDLFAPAGYGKSYIAQRIAREDQHWAIIDGTAVPDAEAFVHALASVQALGCEPGCRADDVLASWNAMSEPITVIVENMEAIADPATRAMLLRMVEMRPQQGKVVLCSRRDIGLRLSDVAAPHLIVTLRADDLRFDDAEMRQLFAETPCDDTALFHIGALTEGWPMAALYVHRLVAEGALEARGETFPDALFSDLFDYVEAQVLGALPPIDLAALVACAAWNDVTDGEIDALYGGTREGVVARLKRVYHVLRSGAQDRLEMHPLVRRAVRGLHRRERVAALRRLADAFVAGEQFARAAECYLLARDVTAAADCAEQVDGGLLTLVASRSEMESVEDATVLHPEVRIAVIAARRFAERAAPLASESLAHFADEALDLPDAVYDAAVGIGVLTLLDAGRVDEAGALIGRLRCDALEGPQPTAAHIVAVVARLWLLTYQGRYDEVLAAWRPLRREAYGNPAWLAQAVRAEVQADRARGRWEVEHDALDRMVSFARRGRATPVLGVALAEAAFGAWLAGEFDLFEEYRTELDLLLRRSEVAGLVSFSLASLGRAPRIGRVSVPLWDARAYLLACGDAVDAEGAARYAQAAIEAADAAAEPFTRVLARLCAAEKIASARATRLREAREICEAIDSPALRDAIADLSRTGEVHGMISPLVNRLRRRSAAIVALDDAALRVNLADGSVHRGEERLDVSEGGLALLAALAVASRPLARDVLVDRLWPDLPAESAYNALKMCVHRTRQQVGDPTAIVVSRVGYGLAPAVAVDLPDLERSLQRIARGEVTSAELPELETSFVRLSSARPASFDLWEWFQPFEQRLQSATREIGEFLGKRALAGGDHVGALTIAQRLVQLDPIDEGARRIAIEAHLAARDRGAAILEFRQYRELLREELNVEPSAALKRLLEAS